MTSSGSSGQYILQKSIEVNIALLYDIKTYLIFTFFNLKKNVKISGETYPPLSAVMFFNQPASLSILNWLRYVFSLDGGVQGVGSTIILLFEREPNSLVHCRKKI